MKEKTEQIIEFEGVDLKDRRILHELDVNARAPASEIARRVGLSRQTANQRITSLLERGIVAGLITMIDIGKLGYSNYDIWIKLERVEDREKLVSHLVKHPNTLWVAECGGRWDLCAATMARNPGHLQSILNGILEEYKNEIRGYGINSIIEYEWYTKGFLLPKTKKGVSGRSGGEQRMLDLDAKDLRILAEIAMNARASTTSVAQKVGLDPVTVAGRMRGMEEKGVICGYGCALQTQRMGMRTYEVLVKMHNLTGDAERRFKAYCSAHPYVYVYLRGIGDWEVDIGVDARSEEHLYEIISDIRGKFPELVKDFEVLSVFHTHKQNFFPRDLL